MLTKIEFNNPETGSLKITNESSSTDELGRFMLNSTYFSMGENLAVFPFVMNALDRSDPVSFLDLYASTLLKLSRDDNTSFRDALLATNGFDVDRYYELTNRQIVTHVSQDWAGTIVTDLCLIKAVLNEGRRGLSSIHNVE
jgi:hypothetical protein